jgi:putative membrane protein insertion efficiency factor
VTAGSTSTGSAAPASAWTWQRVTALPLLALVWAYQLLISPLSPASCRFYPSCSAYAVTALTRFGPVKGSWLALRRLLRCHPWNPGGVDHVPQARRADHHLPEVIAGTANPTASAVTAGPDPGTTT